MSHGLLIVTIITTIFASSGFWVFLQYVFSIHSKRKDAKTEMILGLGELRIIKESKKCIEKGYVTEDQYDVLFNKLYKPYKKLGGNGVAERIIEEVSKLPIKP